MTEENKREMVLKFAYFNDMGREIKEDFNGSDEAYLNSFRRLHIQNYSVPFYLKCRLEEEGIL